MPRLFALSAPAQVRPPYGGAGYNPGRAYKVQMGSQTELSSRIGSGLFHSHAGGVTQPVALHHRGPTLIFPWGGSSKLVVTREGVGGGPGRGDELTILDRYFGP